MAWGNDNPLGALAGNPISKSAVDNLHLLHGYKATWSKAAYCPNRIASTPEKHDFNCTLCDRTKGMYYFDPISVNEDGDDLRLIVTGLSADQQYKVEGYLDEGTSYISFPGEYEPSYYDKIVLEDSRMRVQQLVTVGERESGSADILKFDGIPTTNTDGGIVLLIDSDGADHSSNAEIDANGDLNWTAARPADGTIVSLVYYRRPTYIVLDAPHIVRDNRERSSVTKLGVQVLCRLDHFLKDSARIL